MGKNSGQNCLNLPDLIGNRSIFADGDVRWTRGIPGASVADRAVRPQSAEESSGPGSGGQKSLHPYVQPGEILIYGC